MFSLGYHFWGIALKVSDLTDLFDPVYIFDPLYISLPLKIPLYADN